MLARKGKIWPDYAPLTSSRDRRPTILDNIDVTTQLWFDHYQDLYRLKHVPNIPH